MLPLQGVQVLSLVGELRSRMLWPSREKKKEKKKEEDRNGNNCLTGYRVSLWAVECSGTGEGAGCPKLRMH